MPRQQIKNVKSIEVLRPGNRRQEISDAKIPALRVVVTPTGARSWALRCRVNGRPVKFTLGPVDAHSLAKARQWASDTLLAVKAGRDPRAEKRESAEARKRKPEEEERKRQNTVAAVVERWLASDQAKNRSVDDVRGAMAKYVLPVLGARAISDVKRRDLAEVIEHIHDRGGRDGMGAPTRANRVSAYLKRLFAWALDKELIEVSPALALKKPLEEQSRNRVLDDGELRAIWEACGELDAYGKLVRLLICTGARLREIADAKVCDLTEERDLRLPAGRSKNSKGRIIHLSPLAREVIGKTAGDFLVSVTGRKPVSNLSERKLALDARAAELFGRPLADWRIHDIRRAVATGLQRLKQKLETIEAVLGHTSGSRSGIVAVYQRHAFEEEAATALDSWSDHLRALLEGRAATVVPIRRRG